MADIKVVRGRLLGVTIETSEEIAKRLGSDFVPEGARARSGYAALKLAELRDEIEPRNADRDDDSKLSSDGNKPDLVTALEADDAAQAE